MSHPSMKQRSRRLCVRHGGGARPSWSKAGCASGASPGPHSVEAGSRTASKSTLGDRQMPKYIALAVTVLLWVGLPTIGRAQASTVTPFALHREVDQLPDGSLYWRLQTFATQEAAQAAVGP